MWGSSSKSSTLGTTVMVVRDDIIGQSSSATSFHILPTQSLVGIKKLCLVCTHMYVLEPHLLSQN